MDQQKKYGTRMDVWEGIALSTKGGLKKDDLIYDERHNRVKSKKAIVRGQNLIKSLREGNSKKEEVPIDCCKQQQQQPQPVRPKGRPRKEVSKEISL